MKTLSKIRTISTVLTTFCLAISAVGWEDACAAPVVAATLNSPSEIVEGQPLCVKYTIHNPESDTTLSVNLGNNYTGFYSLLLSTAATHVVIAKTSEPTATQGGESVDPVLDLKPNDSYTQYVVASKYFRNISPGLYRLEMHLTLPYASLHDDALDKSGPTLTKDFSFFLKVMPANSEVLSEQANHLAESIITEHDPDQRKIMLDELFAMPANEASNAWKLLLSNSRSWETEEVSELADFPSKQGADIIARIMDDPTAKSETRQIAAQSLNSMYYASDPDVKSYINTIAQRHNATMPDSPVVVQTRD